MTVSLCMIVRNEEKMLPRCLDSAKDAVDEIVIVDTGSTDQTRSVALAYTPRVYNFPWIDDFAAARNFAFAQATQDYILWLDADDILPPESVGALLLLKAGSHRPDIWMFPYHVGFDSTDRCLLRYYRERLLRREAGLKWIGRVHEVIPLAGTVQTAEVPIEHRPEPKPASDRNLRIYRSMEREGQPLSSRDLYYFGRELFDHGLYDEAAERLGQFLARKNGWIADRKNAYLLLSQCADHQNQPEQVYQYLLQCLALDSPDGRLCCAFGRWHLAQEQYATAMFWFRSALACPRPSEGFVYEDDYTFLPCIWLCVCCDKLGRRKEAEAWNAKAAMYRPDDPAVKHNRAYFANISAEN